MHFYFIARSPDWLASLSSDIKSEQDRDNIISLAIVVCALNPVNSTILSLYSLFPQTLSDIVSSLYEIYFNLLKSSVMFTFTMYMLTKVDDISTVFGLLETLPSYCCNSLSTNLVSSTLLTLTKSVDLCPVAIRLISKSWEKDGQLFECLSKLLNPFGKVSNTEWLISVAATLKDICYMKPYQHGEECLPYIYQLLSCTNDPLVTSLLIKSLISLCANGVTDPGVIWKLLGSRLSLGL